MSKDTIYRQDAIDAVAKLLSDREGGNAVWWKPVAESVIDVLPSAQPEIIRCEECKHGSPNGVYGCRLERYNFNDESVRMYGEDYCSCAERREE